MTAFEPVSVGYWTIRGLGAPLRMMVMYSGAPLNAINYDLRVTADARFDASEWFNEKKKLKEQNPLINLPYVVYEGQLVSQSNACFTFLGRKLGLWGNDEVEILQCEQLLCEIMDLRNKMSRLVYAATVSKCEAVALLEDVMGKNGILQKLEAWLVREVANGRSGTFFVGDHATAPDFHMWEMVDQYLTLAKHYEGPVLLQTLPRLAHFYDTFGALPGNNAYMQSALARMPINQKMAAFGAVPDGGVWVAGMSYDWATTGGRY